MADNISITAGAGTTVSTEEITTLNGGGVSAQHAQRIIAAIRTADGTALDVTSATPLPVAAGAAETHIGQVGGTTVLKDVTLSLSTSVYAADELLADTQQIDAFFRISNGTGMVNSLTVIDKDDQKMALTVYFLDANVSFGTENAAVTITDTNAASILGFVDVLVADYKDLGGVSVANIRGIQQPVKAVTGTDDLYVAVVNGPGAPTYTASGIVLRVGGLVD